MSINFSRRSLTAAARPRRISIVSCCSHAGATFYGLVASRLSKPALAYRLTVSGRRRFTRWVTLIAFAGLTGVASLHAGEADVIDASITSVGGDEYRISVTVKHADTGWDHYANKWDVFDAAGKLIGTRVFHHPHVQEQPFTRPLSLNIPADVSVITLRAHDSVHEDGGAEFTLQVPGS